MNTRDNLFWSVRYRANEDTGSDHVHASNPGTLTRVHANEGGTNIAYAAENAALMTVQGGYSDFPGLKKNIGMEINADIHLIATEFGIGKNTVEP